MNNRNGQLVLQTLESLQEPSTMTKISQTIADAFEADINDVKEIVKETLEGGVHYGYVQRNNQKYFMAPLDVGEMVPKDDDSTMKDVGKEFQDRAARRRRRMGGRRNRRRSGSRRRRRR